ncbi:MAG: hypothetical protein ACJ70W_07055 [Nitrososphaera sp.]
MVLDKTDKKGQGVAREIIESIAEDIAAGIRAKIDKNNHPDDLERSLKIISDDSNQMGFASSLSKEKKDKSFYIESKNCILHKVASNNQDMICHGLHDKIISKSLEGNSTPALN